MKVGVLGGGQLGRMLAQAGKPLGHEFFFLDSKEGVCAAAFGELTVGELTDESVLRDFAEKVDVVTFETENMPVETVEYLEPLVPVHPSKEALRVTQDRLLEKNFCRENGVMTAEFVAVETEEELMSAIGQLGYPCILKTRRMGYDGKGQVFLKSKDDVSEAVKLVEAQQCILEQCVKFDREVSMIATRSKEGEIAYFPLTENVHKEGILHTSRAPAVLDASIEEKAQSLIKTLLEKFEYVGTLTVELFLVGDDLLVNEMAPRVHNSGHWTIEGAQTSQFENHVRALVDMPLGSTELNGHSGMVNILGVYPPREALEGIEGVYIHFYDKEERPKRKIGHVTVCHNEKQVVDVGVEEVIDIVSGS